MKRFCLLVLAIALAIMHSCTDFQEGPMPTYLSVYTKELSFSNNADSQTTIVSSGKRWNVSSMPEWISIQSITTYSPYKWSVSFYASENYSYNREGTIVFKTSAESIDVSVKQEGKKGEYVPVRSVSLSKTELSLTEDDTDNLIATIVPSDASDKSVTWSSDNTDVATVSPSGAVTAKAVGSATITVKTNDGEKTATCSVMVKTKVIPVTGLTLDKSSLTMKEGDAQTLTATVFPSNATDKTVKWSSSDASVASVDQSGNVFALSDGSTVITASVGDKAASCEVTVLFNSSKYLTFEVIKSGNIKWIATGSNIKTIEYTKDSGRTWISITSSNSGTTIPVSSGDIIHFKGNNTAYGNNPRGNNDGYNCFGTEGETSFYAYGPITSLLSENNRNALSRYAFAGLFYGCSGLFSHPRNALELPSTILGYACYMSMFQGCTNLSTSPLLPALKLTDFCYDTMFSDCTGLTVTHDLPATKLASACYQGMYSNCTSLKTAPKLPATSLDLGCYSSMFSGCISLEYAPELPAISLSSVCYSNMFWGCTSLNNAPMLPATSLAESCYRAMFAHCTSLTVAPNLPAMIMAESCYYNMFEFCSSLTKAPELPATTLAPNCYGRMFYYCSNLVSCSELPATVLAEECYNQMFYACSLLSSAIVLPAIELKDECYRTMFAGCNKINQIKCLAKDISAKDCTSFWLNGVSSSGTFICPGSMTSVWSRGDSGIPNGWTIIDD